MTRKQIVLLIVGIVLLIGCVGMGVGLILLPRGQGEPDAPASTDKLTHTVTVTAENGTPLENVGIYIYADETMAELVWFDRTNSQGQMLFTDVALDTYVAVLTDVPTGYGVEDFYPLTGENTTIVLSAAVMSAEDMESVTYQLGDLMMDFSITDTDGNTHTLSELLKTKKAVILNFWYLSCDPCRQEFPFMQEAYEEYQGDLQILAMNPVDQDPAAVAAFKEELGLSFPMAVADPAWAQMMKVTAYPTTVVIDRFGYITLYHKGSVDNTETFRQLFAYFTADDYEQKAIQSLDEIVQIQEGTEDNPLEAGSNGAEVTVGAGKEYYLEFFKVSGMYMQVKGENNDFYVMYNEKKYEPSGNTVGMIVKTDGIYYPVKITVGNTGSKEQKIVISFSALQGTINNPFKMTLGEFTANTTAGNEQGVYYTYTAEKNGTLTVTCLQASVKNYDYYLYNLRSYALRNATSDGVLDEDGNMTVSLAVKQGDPVQFSVGVLRDEANYIAAGTFKFLAELEDGTGEEDTGPELPKTTYTITVKDENDGPMAGVFVDFTGEFTFIPEEPDPDVPADDPAYQIAVNELLTTDENGTVTTEQVTGSYTVAIRIPDGYTLETTRYVLTPEAPELTVKLKKVVMRDYSVKVQYEDGTAAENVIVMVGSSFAYTDAQGCVSFHLPEDTYQVSLSGLPQGYEAKPGEADTLTPEVTALTLTLIKCGTAENPYRVTDLTFMPPAVAPGEGVHIQYFYESNPVLTVEDPDAQVIYNGVTYTANAETGILEVPLNESTLDVPVDLQVVNGGQTEKAFVLKLVYPVGTKWNPELATNPAMIQLILAEGDEDGHYYQYLNGQGGTLTTKIFMVSPSKVANTVTVITETNGETVLGKEDSRFYVKYGEPVIIHAQATPVETPVVDEQTGEPTGEILTTIPAVKIYLSGSFEVDPNAKPEEDDNIPPVPDGKQLYTVALKDFDGNPVSDVMVQFVSDGRQVAAFMTGASGKAYAALEPGDYTVRLASLGSKQYYYEPLQAVLSAQAATLELPVTSVVPGEAEEHWGIGSFKPVSLGGTYCTMQADVINYFVFAPTQQGVYRFTTSDPAAVISYWGTTNYPMDMTAETDYADNAFTREVTASGIGQSFVIGITNAPDCILIVTRIGDAHEEIPDEIYEAQTPPTQFTFTMPAGKELVFVDLKGRTEDFQAVYNETDGYYHLNSADGPLLYVQLTDNVADPNNPVAPPYVPLYRMVGGMGDNTGTALRGTYVNEEGVVVRQDYTDCVLAYGACADKTYGIYPLTQDLVYMIQRGGEYKGWWDPENSTGNLLFKDEEGVLNPEINLELGWMFAVCYVKE